MYLINNRTEGELGNFLKLIYKIKSDERKANIWAPTDALAQAFDASETLRGNKKLRDEVFHTGWFNKNITETPIHGDFLGWVMTDALYDSETCKTLVEQEKYLHKVNEELTAAFDAGILQKDERFQIVSSMGGMTALETLLLSRYIVEEYLIHLIPICVYIPGSVPQDVGNADLTAKASDFTNMTFSAEKTSRHFSTNIIIRIIFLIYSVVQSVLFVTACRGVYRSVIAIFRNKKFFSEREYLTLTTTFGLLILSLVYAFAIAWFCYFLICARRTFGGLEALQFYSTALIPMLMLFEILGTCLFSRLRKVKLRRF